MKEFLIRTSTAIFLILFVYVIIKFLPFHFFSICLYLIASFAVYEFVRLANPNVYSWPIIFLSGILIGLSFTFSKPDLLLSITLIIIILGLYFLIFTNRQKYLSTFVKDIGVHYLVVFYLYIPLYFLLELKKLGANFLFFLIGVIAIGDSAAYFIGRAIGKHQIYPIASPKKTFEGLFAGIVFASLGGWLLINIFPIEVKWWLSMVTGGILGLVSQISDPVESLFKRSANKKDSGTILPGHGGILDRIDSYIFCAPVFSYIVKLFWF